MKRSGKRHEPAVLLFERAMIADRTRRYRRFKVQERKLIMGNIPPYGYRYVKKDRQLSAEGHYEVDPEEARVVTMMFSWVAEGALSSRAAQYDIRVSESDTIDASNHARLTALASHNNSLWRDDRNAKTHNCSPQYAVAQ
jgi:hypothetical protein